MIKLPFGVTSFLAGCERWTFLRYQQVNGDSRIVNLHLGSLGGKCQCRNKQPYIVCLGRFLLKQKIVGDFNQFEDS